MNDRQPYEQHLADKLQQLPPPMEQDKAWAQMKALLDEELPRGGANGNGHWWIIGMIAGILLIGTWMFIQNSGTDTHAAKNMTAIENTQPSGSDGTTPGNNDRAAVKHPPGAGSAEGTPSGKPVRTKANADAARTEHDLSSAKKPNTGPDRSSGDPPLTDKDIPIKEPPLANNPLTHNPDNPKLSAYRNKSTQSKTQKGKDKEATNVSEQPNKLTEQHNDDAQVTDRDISRHQVVEKGKFARNKPEKLSAKNSRIADRPQLSRSQNKQQDNPDKISGSMPEDLAANYPDFETDLVVPGNQINEHYAHDFSLLKLNEKKSNPSPKKNFRKRANPDRAFAIGLSLPLAFPVADQQALSYNWRGGANTVSDYIPSPHLQYHVNKKTFFQTEIQVISPQYIRPVLLYQQKSQVGAGAWQYNSVIARKLYYFNLPVSVYHSPLPNFFLGTGLQFSTLMSGVGMYESRTITGDQDVLNSQKFQRIGKDSLTNRMTTSELRLLLDVNYYWQRFTVGLRYNQALGNYLSFRLNSTSNFTYDKNKALFFYLRYNIWDDRKHKQSGKQLLSLK
ncbi:PorT family protein [Pseudoflavitalea sp. G-6-1-2]|uniref:hypothetical protein n=1 Tax=Pseudoflavitalea sp. G-6-1-2 TaxID=2728841 RepID=UPI00146DDE56|nr:hypothetical protein [Pseudoflavitalea sp. G-6-1-2]NML19652.1 PorT family protein [Pseudoflavitalea sp. G-6-1-2]